MVRAARRRLILSLACVMGAVLLCAGVLVYLLLTHELDRAVDAQLRSQDAAFVKVAVTGSIAAGDPAGPTTGGAVPGGEVTALPPHPDPPPAGAAQGGLIVSYQPPVDAAGVFSVQISGGELLAARGTVPPGFPVAAAAAAARPDRDDLRTTTLDGKRYRLLSHYTGTTPGGKPIVVQTAVSLAARDREQRTVLLGLAAGGLAGLLLTVAGVGWLTRRALAPLQLAFQRQRRFVGDAAHELRTPLALLRLEAEDLALRLQREEEARPLFRQVDRVTRLAGDLLSLARLDHERQRCEREPVHAASLLAELAGAARALAAPAVSVELCVPDGLWLASDRDRLHQLLLIFIDNACRVTPPLGRIGLSAAASGGSATLAIEDSGPGLPSGPIARLFEPFYRPDAARSRSEGGAGLGLAIAHELARLLGGTLRLENGRAGGAVASVTLPRIPSPEGAAASEAGVTV
ncbi:MAG TPA: HAMP domain-containing sensor histidine kinase [Dehalococcoidia bacterium]|nr:HAMP domain-containing sensor histidine kinase [Dehalococcoidia bacterium]